MGEPDAKGLVGTGFCCVAVVAVAADADQGRASGAHWQSLLHLLHLVAEAHHQRCQTSQALAVLTHTQGHQAPAGFAGFASASDSCAHTHTMALAQLQEIALQQQPKSRHQLSAMATSIQHNPRDVSKPGRPGSATMTIFMRSLKRLHMSLMLNQVKMLVKIAIILGISVKRRNLTSKGKDDIGAKT